MTFLTKSTKSMSVNDIDRKWHLIDLKGKILGRVSPAIVSLLMGKHRSNYSPNLDSGDYVVVINARRVEVTGKKAQNKVYSRYSGYPGGLTEMTYAELMIKNPTEIIRRSVAGMLPKNKLRDKRMARFYIYADEKHPYEGKLQMSVKKS